MAGSSLQIDDQYCIDMGDYFKREGETFERFIDEYIKTLEKIKANGIIKGDVSNALKSYIKYAKKLKNQIGNISLTAQEQTKKFVSAIDSADQYIF